jgi:DNA-binding transcriptional LysR family regulator
MYGALPEVLGAFRAQRPDVDLALRELPTSSQIEALTEGRLDVGFVRPGASHPELAVEVLLRERVVAALPPDHLLAERERLALTDLQDESFVLLGRREAPGLHHALIAALARRGVEPRVGQEVAEMQTLIGLVVAGLGVSLVPESVAALERRGVTYRPLAAPVPTVELVLAWRAANEGPVLSAFLEVVREHVPHEDRPQK